MSSSVFVKLRRAKGRGPSVSRSAGKGSPRGSRWPSRAWARGLGVTCLCQAPGRRKLEGALEAACPQAAAHRPPGRGVGPAVRPDWRAGRQLADQRAVHGSPGRRWVCRGRPSLASRVLGRAAPRLGVTHPTGRTWPGTRMSSGGGEGAHGRAPQAPGPPEFSADVSKLHSSDSTP